MFRKDLLIFDWPGRHNLQVVLPSAILFAALLHVGVFYLFRIVYPRAAASGPESVQIYFVPKGAADDVRLATLLHSADPALFAPGRGLTRNEPIISEPYTPQYDAQRAVFDPLPVMSWPPKETPRHYGAVPSTIPHSMPVKKLEAPRSRLTAEGSLVKRLPTLPNSTQFEVQVRQSLEPTIFLIAVRPDGSVAHIVPQQHGSGDATLDETALKLLKSVRFAPATGGDEWGFVSFQWGADVRLVESP